MNLEKELRKWRRLSVALILALLFGTYVSFRQNLVIQQQRTLIKELYHAIVATETVGHAVK